MNKAHTNLVGQRFDSLLVIELSHKKPSKDSRIGEHFMWKCKCDCGRERIISGTSLFKGVRCICARYDKVRGIPRRDFSGQVFGEWKILKFIRYKRQPSAKAIYLCKCNCGTEKELYVETLFSGQSSSCGCKSVERRLKTFYNDYPIEGRELKDIYNHYKGNANKREFSLSYEDAAVLFLQNCHYCNKPPSNLLKANWGEHYKYSGLDRVDNTLGYHSNNVVPCCIDCNRAKHALKLEDFKEMIKSIYNHYILKDNA